MHITFRNRFVLILTMVLAVASCYWLSQTLAGHMTAAYAQVTAKPFVLQMEGYNYGWNPVPGTLIERKTIAQRSDGSRVEVSNFGPISLGQTARRIQFINGRTVLLVDGLGVKANGTLPADKLTAYKSKLLHPTASCISPGSLDGGQDDVLGHPVTKLTRNNVGWVTTLLVAPDLGCQVLGFRVEDRQTDGSLKLRAEYRTVSLQFTEPDSSLFDEGAHYTAMKPSEIEHHFLQTMNIPETARLLKEEGLADKNFGAQ